MNDAQHEHDGAHQYCSPQALTFSRSGEMEAKDHPLAGAPQADDRQSSAADGGDHATPSADRRDHAIPAADEGDHAASVDEGDRSAPVVDGEDHAGAAAAEVTATAGHSDEPQEDLSFTRYLRYRFEQDRLIASLFAPLTLFCASRACDADWAWYWFWPMVGCYLWLAKINRRGSGLMGIPIVDNLDFSRELHGTLIDRRLFDVLGALSRIGQLTLIGLFISRRILSHLIHESFDKDWGNIVVFNAWTSTSFQVAYALAYELREFKANGAAQSHGHGRLDVYMRFLRHISADSLGHVALCVLIMNLCFMGSFIAHSSIWIVALPMMLWSMWFLFRFLRDRHPNWTRAVIAYLAVYTGLLFWLLYHSPRATFFYGYLPINYTVATSPLWLSGVILFFVSYGHQTSVLQAPARFFGGIFQRLDSMLRLPIQQTELTETQTTYCKRELCAALGSILLRPVVSKLHSRAGFVYDIALIVCWIGWLLPELRHASRRATYGLRVDNFLASSATIWDDSSHGLVFIVVMSYGIEYALPLSFKFLACFVFFVLWCTFQQLIVLGVIQRNVILLTASSANPFGAPGFLSSVFPYVLPALSLYLWGQHSLLENIGVISCTCQWRHYEISPNVYTIGLLHGFIAAVFYWSMGFDPLVEVWNMFA